MSSPPPGLGCRIGPYELDLRSGDLSRNGRRIHLQEKPRSILLALAERPRQVVSRAELHERLWPEETFVDFEDGLNTAMRKLREALGDDSQSPRYIETLRGRGYRLLTDVVPTPADGVAEGAVTGAEQSNGMGAHLAGQRANGDAANSDAANGEAHSVRSLDRGSAETPGRTGLRRRIWPFVLGCGVATMALGGWYWLTQSRPVLSFSSHDLVLIADFDNQTGDARFDNALRMALTVSLEQTRYASIFSRLQTANVLQRMNAKEDKRITETVGREICQRENIPGLIVPGITRTGGQFRLTAQLIDPASGVTVRSYAQEAHGEDQILAALDAISVDIRHDLGESRYRIQRSHRSLPEVTTASFAALEDYANASVLWNQSKANEAVALYKAAIATDPDFAMAHSGLGAAYYSFYFNEPDLGEQEFRKALGLSARVTDRERSLIEIRYASAQGRVQDALQLDHNYLQQYPDDWDVRDVYARLLRMNGHLQDSIEIYRDLLRRSPDSAATYVELATAYSQAGQWAQSIQYYEKAFSLDPSQRVAGNVNREYGFTLVRNGEVPKAEQVFLALLSDPAQYAVGERSLAFLDLYRGQYKSARQRLMLALAKSNAPFSAARIRYMLAVVAAGEGNKQEQLAQLDRIMENFGDLNLKVMYGSLLGQSYARSGKVDKAKKLLTMIAPLVDERADDQTTYIQLLKAEVAEASGDFQGALQFLKPPGADDSNASAALTREALANLYQKTGNTEEAMIWLRQFVNDSGSDPIGWEPQQKLFEAYYNLAREYEQKGDRADAMSSLTNLLDKWKDADRDLPLLRDALSLRNQLTSQ